jgi:hypothetical protein
MLLGRLLQGRQPPPEARGPVLHTGALALGSCMGNGKSAHAVQLYALHVTRDALHVTREVCVCALRHPGLRSHTLWPVTHTLMQCTHAGTSTGPPGLHAIGADCCHYTCPYVLGADCCHFTCPCML